jgi:hypothetical protein
MRTMIEVIEVLQEIIKLPEKLQGTEQIWDIFGALALCVKEAAVQIRIEHDWNDKIQLRFRIEGDSHQGRGATLQEAWAEFIRLKSPPPPPPVTDKIAEVERLLNVPPDATKLPAEVIAEPKEEA